MQFRFCVLYLLDTIMIALFIDTHDSDKCANDKNTHMHDLSLSLSLSFFFALFHSY